LSAKSTPGKKYSDFFVATATPGANPTIANYNAKNSLVRFEKNLPVKKLLYPTTTLAL
jgi:hypothetical protein